MEKIIFDKYSDTNLNCFRNKINYYLYKVIWVLIFSIVLNLVLFISACLFSIGNKNALTIILWYISAVSVGFCGGAMGQMFHPAIINDRKFSTVFLILISTLCACKTNILNSNLYFITYFLYFRQLKISHQFAKYQIVENL